MTRAAKSATTGMGVARKCPPNKLNCRLDATENLREANGKLSAARVAKLYGVSLRQLAGWLGAEGTNCEQGAGLRLLPGGSELFRARGAIAGADEGRLCNDYEFRQWLRMTHPGSGASHTQKSGDCNPRINSHSEGGCRLKIGQPR